MADDFWVFGYGSLMWYPGFEFEESCPACLSGYTRSFCIYSHYYRGTPEKPGLVLGLDPVQDGACEGVAFRIHPENKDHVIAYLTERELCGYAYRPETLKIRLDEGRNIWAHTFVADPEHPHYAGDLGLEDAARLIMDAEGKTGLNRDYLINSVRELEAHGFVDERLHRLLKQVEYLTGMIEAGGGI